MKRGFTLENKMKMALLLFVVFAGLLIRNLVTKQQFSELGSSFNSVYKDRLLVESYIYEISNCLHAKSAMLDNGSSPAGSGTTPTTIGRQNTEIDRLVVAYEQTELTKNEARVLASLKHRLQSLDKLEHTYRNRLEYGYPVGDLKTDMALVLTGASADLHALSSIQLAVGKDMNDQSQKILSESTVFSQFAIVLLIVIGLIIQVLIFRSNEVVRTKLPDIHLN